MEGQRPFMTADGSTRIETVAELLQRQLDRSGASSLRSHPSNIVFRHAHVYIFA